MQSVPFGNYSLQGRVYAIDKADGQHVWLIDQYPQTAQYANIIMSYTLFTKLSHKETSPTIHRWNPRSRTWNTKYL